MTIGKQENQLSREEIEVCLNRAGYILEVLEEEPYSVGRIVRKGEDLCAYVYLNRDEAVEHNDSGNEDFNPKHNCPFVAIFYGDEYLLRSPLSYFVDNGRLYEFCITAGIPTQEFVIDVQDGESEGLKIARKTLSRLETQLEGN